jgi:maleylacetate reductase
MTVTSALNAMAHAAEALYAVNRNPVSTMLAIEGLRAFAAALPKVIDNPKDLEARGETLYGAWLCGTVLGQVGMALHHKLCHTLGGSFDLPHAETHAVVLPHAIAYNARAVPELLAPICEIFGGTNAGRALFDFARSWRTDGAERAWVQARAISQSRRSGHQQTLLEPAPVTRPASRSAAGRLGRRTARRMTNLFHRSSGRMT